MKSVKARKQRKAFYNAPLHKKQKSIASHLEENLLLKYDQRSVPLITGDTVKVMRGVFKGHEDKVAKIHVKDYRVEVEGVTITKADGKKIAKPLHPSNLLITKLNLTDKWRRNNLERKVSEDTKKEIEAEAKQQLIEQEKERKRLEEEQLAAEKEAEAEEESIEPEVEEPIVEEPETKKPVAKKTEKSEPKEKKTAGTPAKKSKPPAKKPAEKKEDKKEDTA